MSGERILRVLAWHVHGSYTNALVQGRHTWLLPVTPDRGPEGRGRARTWDWPANAVEVDRQQAAAAEVDVVVLQRPEEWRWAVEWLGGRRPGVDVPAVYLEHNTPPDAVGSKLHPALELPPMPIVHVTHTNRMLWDCGGARTLVVEHGIPDPGYRFTGELAAACAAVNEPVRRGRAVGADLLVELGRDVPVHLFGMGTEPLGGRDVAQGVLHDEMARRRVYLHPYRWTSLGLALLEAMHLGLPVAAPAMTEVPRAVPPEAGIVTNDLDELADGLRRLVHDPEEAAAMGKRARAAVLERHSLGRFLHDWDRLLMEVCA